MRVIIVEDQVMFRDILRKGVAELHHQVVGETASGVAALALVAKLRPDLLLLDLSLPDLNGYAVIERTRESYPNTRIVVISAYLNDYTVLNLDRNRVDGFIDKGTDQLTALKAALAQVASGKKYFSPSYEALRRGRFNDSNWFAKRLSRTELTVLTLAADGYDNAEIGNKLGISTRTAQTHRTHIFRKLCLRSTPKLMAFGREHGFDHQSVDLAR